MPPLLVSGVATVSNNSLGGHSRGSLSPAGQEDARLGLPAATGTLALGTPHHHVPCNTLQPAYAQATVLTAVKRGNG